jgi:hypothetical protein
MIRELVVDNAVKLHTAKAAGSRRISCSSPVTVIFGPGRVAAFALAAARNYHLKIDAH